MARLTRSEARSILSRCLHNPLHDFHELRSRDVEALIAEADRLRYRKPKNAPGSRARMFHAYLMCAANRKEG